jgi:starch phosphorylase
VRWSRNVTQRWPEVNFVDAGIGPDSAVLSGSSLPLRARLDLAGLSPQDVRVEAVVGRVGARGELEETQVLTLDPLEQHGNQFLFGRDFAPLATGRLGYSVRVTPNHCDDPLNRPCNAPLKWVGNMPFSG